MTSQSGAITISHRDKKDGWIPNPRDLSTTPGGSIYATTPGGTKIKYNREDLLAMRNSPLAKTPTKLPIIPGVTAPDEPPEAKTKKTKKVQNAEPVDDSGVFQMEQ